MHGFSSGSTLLINAEVDSMGRVTDDGAGIGMKTSPHRAAIQKAQAELRLEYDVCEERRRELEFLEKGGNPLDFKYGHAASASVQSTSLADQHADQCTNSEARGSFAFTTSPHGDSLESSGRLGDTVACEPNIADNFDGENQLLESSRKPKYPRSNITPPEHSQLYAKELEGLPIFHPKRGQAYRRGNRSRTKHHVARSPSTYISSRGTHANDATSSARTSILEGRPDPSANNILDHHKARDMTAQRPNLNMASEEPHFSKASDLAAPVGSICPSYVDEIKNHQAPLLLNESSKLKVEDKCTQTDGIRSSVGFTTKVLDSEYSCSQTSLSVYRNRNRDNELCNLRVDSDGATKGEKLAEMINANYNKIIERKGVVDSAESGLCPNANHNYVVQSNRENGFMDEDDTKMHGSRSYVQNEANRSSYIEELEPKHHPEFKSHMKENASLDPNHNLQSSSSPRNLQVSRVSCSMELTQAVVPGPIPSTELPTSGENQLEVSDKAYEDRILAETKIIVQEKQKRIDKLGLHSRPREYHMKSHWEFVLEEMAWLANDFAQESLWKMTAAAQICHRVAFASHLRSKDKDRHERLRFIARTLANAVLQFWESAGLLLQGDGICSSPESSKCGTVTFRKMDDIEGRITDPGEVPEKDTELRPERHKKCLVLPVRQYAMRFLQYNSSVTSSVRAATLETAEPVSDLSMQDISWKDQFTEENLFYIIPPGSMETYKKMIESYLACSEDKGNNRQDDAVAFMYDAATEFGSQENEYEEEEGESVYYLPRAFENSRSLKIAHKKRKKLKSYTARSCEFGGGLSYDNCIKNRVGAPQFRLLGKRFLNSLKVGPIPTKRMRTASRQRVAGLVGEGAARGVPTLLRADALSGDTNSFQDDQSMLHGGCITEKGVEVESGMDFDKQSIFDPTEVHEESKKKKKAEYQAITYGNKWKIKSMQNEQRDNLKRSADGHQPESNGSTGMFVHHTKKPKLMKHLYDNSSENAIQMSGSTTSPPAPLSNMSYPNRLTKFIGDRDHIRKVNLAKVPIHHPSSGNEWTLYEDQELVVLVHDMGPNWELVSDAFNSTSLFKCVFRRPIECKERHRVLMDGTSVDEADKAGDSGTSQPYRSTLSGIPKGSVRQLFRQLRGPLEEDTLKSHFEKIILLRPRLTQRKKQNDNQDPKQIAPVHGSHATTLSQVIPNNVNGGVLTPLDLCDVSVSSPDGCPVGCQPTSGLASPSHGVIPSVLLPGGNASLHNSPDLSTINGSIRDWRYGVPGMSLLSIDDLQRVRQYNHMLPSRSNQHSSSPTPGVDRNMRTVPGDGMGMIPGMNRRMPMPKPGFQGIVSSAMLSSGTMLGMPSHINKHSAVGPGQGNSILKAGETMQYPQPNQSVDHRHQMMLPEMQVLVTQANSQGVPPFSGLSSSIHYQSPSLPVQSFPVHNQQQHQVPQNSNAMTNSHCPHPHGTTHPSSADQQAFLKCDRNQQQRMLHLQHQQQQLQKQKRRQLQLPASSALITHGQTHSYLPMSSPNQNSSLIQSINPSRPVSLPAVAPLSSSTPSPQQHKHQLPSHGIRRNSASGVSEGMSQIGKQRSRQTIQQHQHEKFEQSLRNHPNQYQQPQSANQVKRFKGIGRGNMLMQNLPLDPSHLNSLSTTQVNQGVGNGDQPMYLMQGHGVCSGSKRLVPPQDSGQIQPSSSSPPLPTKQVQQMPFHSDGSNQNHVGAVPLTVGGPASTQPLRPTLVTSHSQQMEGQHHPPVKLVNESQAVYQGPVQQCCHLTADSLARPQPEHPQQEQQLVNNSSELSVTSSILRTSMESSYPVTQASSSSTVSVVSSSPLMGGPIRSPQTPVSSGDEPSPMGVRGMDQRQLQENLPLHNTVGMQKHQQRSNLPQLLQQHQALQIQTEQISSHVRPFNSGVE